MKELRDKWLKEWLKDNWPDAPPPSPAGVSNPPEGPSGVTLVASADCAGAAGELAALREEVAATGRDLLANYTVVE